MPQLLVSDPRVPPPNQLPANFQLIPDTVVSNADVNMCPPSLLGKRPIGEEPDAHAQQQELDACAQQLMAGGSTGDFVADITRCFASREAARIEREQLLRANLNRRMCVTSNPPVPDTVVSNALVPMACPQDPVLSQIIKRQTRRQTLRTQNPRESLCPVPSTAPKFTSLCGLPVDGYTSGIPCLRGYSPALPVVSTGAVPDTVISNPNVNTGQSVEDIDLPPADGV